MSLLSSSKLYISLNQSDERSSNNSKNFSFSYIRMMIVRTYANQFEYIGGFHGEDKFLTFEGSFLKGEYLILIESINLNEIKPKLIIDAYGEKSVSFEELDGIYKQNYIRMQCGIVKNFCKKLPRAKHLDEKDYQEEGCREIKRFYGEMDGIWFLYYVNTSEK